MKKKIFTILTSFILSLCLCLNIFAFSDTLNIEINGAKRTIEHSFENKDGFIMVDALDLINLLDLEYTYDASSGSMSLYNNVDTLVMKVNNKSATLNGESIKLSATPQRSDGSIKLPFRLIAELFGYNVIYDTQNQVIELSNESNFEERLEQLDNITENTKVYTYEEALQKSIDNSTNMSLVELQFQQLEDQLESVEQQIDETPDYSIDTGTGLYNPYSSVLRTLLQSKDSITDALDLEDASIQVVEEGLEIGLISALNTYETSKINYLLAEDAIKLQKVNLDNAKIKYSVGMISESAVKDAENQYEQLLITLDSLETVLNSSRRAINIAMGINPLYDTHVEYDSSISQEDYNNINLKLVVSDASTNSLTIKQAENSVNQAERACHYYESTSDQREKEVNLKIAKTNLLQAKRDVESNVRSSYDNLTQLVNNDRTLRVKEEDAINQYNNAVVSYNVGYITMYELRAAELAVTRAKCDIVQNELNYSALIYQLQHPDLF